MKPQICSADIEELTRKTGNYKQFAVFLNMLESAITKARSVLINGFLPLPIAHLRSHVVQ